MIDWVNERDKTYSFLFVINFLNNTNYSLPISDFGNTCFFLFSPNFLNNENMLLPLLGFGAMTDLLKIFFNINVNHP